MEVSQGEVLLCLSRLTNNLGHVFAGASLPFSA
jgi:hypothetical protein